MNHGTQFNNVLYGGIDFELPGNGGQACGNFLSGYHRVFETVVALAVSCACLTFGYNNLVLPEQSKIIRKDRGGKRLLLVILCLVFGIEIGFKFATQSLIFLLNPCHVTTACQVISTHPLLQETGTFFLFFSCLDLPTGSTTKCIGD